ncbi:MAG TPA: hypothetical protein VK157_00675 [Phycisphaerales bacterium]|nr:hypothetical protein [Phycisphaerales bacterium]
MQVSKALALMVVAGLVAPVWSQVVTPPPSEVPPVDEHIEKMPVPPARPADAPQSVPVQAQPKQPQVVLPDLPYEPLAQKDEAGNFKPLTEPLQMAALRANPTINDKEQFMADVKPLLAERAIAVQNVMVSNLDLLERVDDGVFERVNLKDQASIKQLLEVTKPFLPPAAPKGVLETLRDAGKLDPVQFAFAQKIARDYTLTVNPAPEKTIDEAEQARVSMQRAAALLKNGSLEEYVFMFNQMKAASAENFDTLVGMMEGLDDGKKSELAKIGEAVKAASTKADKVAALRPLRDVLTLDQRKDWAKHCVIMIPQ